MHQTSIGRIPKSRCRNRERERSARRAAAKCRPVGSGLPQKDRTGQIFAPGAQVQFLRRVHNSQQGPTERVSELLFAVTKAESSDSCPQCGDISTAFLVNNSTIRQHAEANSAVSGSHEHGAAAGSFSSCRGEAKDSSSE